MSSGELCDCPRRDHPVPPWLDAHPEQDTLMVERGACRNYAERAKDGGACASCRKEHGQP